MLAHAFLTVMAAAQPSPVPDGEELIPLTRHEIRRLFSGLDITIPSGVANAVHPLH